MTAAPAADPIWDAAAHLIELDGGEVRLPAPRPITATVSCEPEMSGLLLDFEPLWELAGRSR